MTLERGLDRLFSRQTRSLIENSLIVAEAYMREQAQFIRADTYMDHADGALFCIQKAKQIIDEQGDGIFGPA